MVKFLKIVDALCNLQDVTIWQNDMKKQKAPRNKKNFKKKSCTHQNRTLTALMTLTEVRTCDLQYLP